MREKNEKERGERSGAERSGAERIGCDRNSTMCVRETLIFSLTYKSVVQKVVSFIRSAECDER
jgi:hypothetical protein